MSFILDAIKKSDRKRNEARTPDLDPAHAQDLPASRRPVWRWLLLVALLFNGALLFWYLTDERTAPAVVAESQAPVSGRLAAPQATTSAAERASRQAPLAAAGAESSAAASSEIPLFRTRIYAIAELPPAVRRRIPELHMSLHAYSSEDVAGRMVRVNDQILRQGGVLEGKFLLEEIRADGAIFRFEGYRFLLPRRS